MFKNQNKQLFVSTVGHTPLAPEELYSTPEQFLESITQKINVFEAIYKCINVLVLPVTTIEDEYVVVVFEIMSQKLRDFYGGSYLIQQWTKKQKIFQAVHNDKPSNFFLTQQRFIYSLQGTSEDCKFLYVTNFYQNVFQKINHPFFNEDNENGIHDVSLYVDPKQVLVVNGSKIFWAQLKIENILTMSPSNVRLEIISKTQANPEQSQGTFDAIEEEIPESCTIEQQLNYIDVLENCSYDDNIEDICKVYYVSNEGFLRKEIHIVVETELKIRILSLDPVKSGNSAETFDLKEVLEFEKKFAEIGINDMIKSISLENYADQENLIVILKSNGESKMMSRDIMQMMIDYQNSTRQAGEEEESSEDEDELARLAALEEKKKRLCYRMTKLCRGNDDIVAPEKKTKVSDVSNPILKNIRNFFVSQLQINFFEVQRYFIRRQQIYFESRSGEIRRTNINLIKNTDAVTGANKINYLIEIAMLQDITLHINTFNDFLIANTTLIICHQKILSIFDFLTKQWTHMLPSEQGNVDQQSQTYFGMPDDEIESLLLNFIFTNNIYDCIIKYRGKFIRRLKYYNKLDKTYFEKGKIFENQNVLQLQRNVDTRNYRQYGDSTIRTLFMIEDKLMQDQQIWVSENGDRITKLVVQIPINLGWQLVDIPNARSDMLIIYSKVERNITIYNIPNSKQCLYPSQLQKYQIQKLENIDYDPSKKKQYFLFQDKIYYQADGNLMVLNLRMKQNALQMINFNKTIKELYMTHEESVYYKDKNNIFRFAQLEIQKEFNIETQPTEVFNCRGAFCTKLEYSITTNRIALFNSSFEISIIPLLDRYRIDLMASQDFDANFICWKEIDNKLIALQQPNILITWNTDTGKIISYQKVEGLDFSQYARHSQWNGQILLKQQKDFQSHQKDISNAKSHINSDDSYDFDNDSDRAENENLLFNSNNQNAHLYSLIEIKSPYEVVQHCSFKYNFKAGMNLYVSMPYLLVMDELCTKQFLLQGKNTLKYPRIMNSFYEPQMKLGRPLYFSPNFHHRMFIDPQTKEIVLNFTLTNANIHSMPIRKQLMFQIEKTHPMIYFHDNDHLVYLTIQGVEKMFNFKTTVATKRRKATCKLIETANIYYNEKTFVRRFILDPLSLNPSQASQMCPEDILKFRGDILKRYLHLDVYQTTKNDQKTFAISRFFQDKNLSLFTHFIINNYRQQLTFNYLNWKVMNQLAEKKIALKELNPKFVSELSFTVLPYNKNIYHILGKDYEVLDGFIEYVNNENIEQDMQEEIELTEVQFIPDLESRTPLHDSVDTNNTRITDRFVQALMQTDFDHHSRFILNIYPQLISQVPQRMSTYLDSRLKIPQWISEYTRGRIETGNDCDFVMTADKMWSENLDLSLQGKLYQPDVLEVPLTMEILDLPHLHKYKNEIADEFLFKLAETKCIEIFSNKSIQALIEIKWPLVKTAVKKYLFYPYLVYLLTFLFYTVHIFEKFQIEKQSQEAQAANDTANEEQSAVPDFEKLQDPQYWIKNEKFLVKSIVQLFTCYFFALEIRQMHISGLGRYLTSSWNYLDIIPLVLITFSISFENLGLAPEYERPLNAVACFFMWIKFLYFWRIFRQTSKFISMIVAIISDLQVFLMVFLVTLTAFGNSMYIMSNNNPECDAECEALPEEERPKGRFIHSLLDSVFFAYRMSLGDFDTEDLGSVQRFLAMITFVIGTLFLTIMMLNLLVAVISDSYARVESTSVEEMYKNFADLIAENEYLVYSNKLEDHDDMGDYLYIAKVDKNDDADGEAWEGKLENVKKQMIKKTEHIENMLKASQRNLLNQIQIHQETYTHLMKEANLKNDQRVQYCVKRMEGNLPKRGKYDSQSSISGFKIGDEDKNRSPEIFQKAGSKFGKGLADGITELTKQDKKRSTLKK